MHKMHYKPVVRPDRTERLRLESELSRCPFCGTQATMLDDRISCDACLCDMQRANGESDAELAASWNRRVP